MRQLGRKLGNILIPPFKKNHSLDRQLNTANSAMLCVIEHLLRGPIRALYPF